MHAFDKNTRSLQSNYQYLNILSFEVEDLGGVFLKTIRSDIIIHDYSVDYSHFQCMAINSGGLVKSAITINIDSKAELLIGKIPPDLAGFLLYQRAKCGHHACLCVIYRIMKRRRCTHYRIMTMTRILDGLSQLGRHAYLFHSLIIANSAEHLNS